MILERVADLGALSLDWLWLPLAAWTALWIVAEALLRVLPTGHPMVRYRVNQALLFSLPVGIASSALLDLSFLIPPPPPVIVEDLPGQVIGGTPIPITETLQPAATLPTLELVAGLGAVVAMLLAAGGIVHLAIRVAAFARFRRDIRRSAINRGNDDLTAVIESASVPRNVRLLETQLDIVPMTFGLIRPTIVLPTNLSEAERRLAIRHELTHIRHLDYPARLIELATGAVFAFHPAAALLSRRCQLLREMTCDASLLDNPADRTAYASLLLRFASPPSTSVPVTVSMADTIPHIISRLNAMQTLNSNSRIRPQILASILAILVLVTFSLGPAASHSVAQDAPEITVVRAGERNPIVEVDGVEIEGGLQSIDPSTIATIDVVKNEDAIAAYGERARDGLIRIRTIQSAALPDTAITFVVVEQMPELIGGLASIQQRLRYPQEAREAGLEGRVFVQFVVDEEGNVRDAQVVRGAGSGLDEAALEAVKEARFKPGMQRGRAVQVRMSLPVTFRLDGESPRQEQPRLQTTLSTVDVTDADVTIRGRVVDSVTREPVVGANVLFTMHERTFGAATDPDGHFRVRITRVAGKPANPSMTVSHDSYPEGLPQSLNTVDAPPPGVPAGFAIRGAYPNPFNPSVTLAFSLPEAATVAVALFDVSGREVLSVPSRSLEASERHEIAIDGSNLASGMYLYRLTATVDGRPHTLSGTVTLLK
jgi:TonB family protein